MNALGFIFDGGSGHPLSGRVERMARYLMNHANRIITRDAIATDCGIAAGRAVDTYASEIRRALGGIDKIVSSHGRGYGWMGEPVDLVPVVRQHCKPVRNDAMCRYAVMSQEEVAKRLGLTTQAVSLIETKALAKLRKKPELKQAWMDLLQHRPRVAYDPFHEVWLFSVAESLATHPETQDDNPNDPD